MLSRASRVCTQKLGHSVRPVGVLTVGVGAGTCLLYPGQGDKLKAALLDRCQLPATSISIFRTSAAAVKCEEVKCEDRESPVDTDEPVFSLAEVEKHANGASIWVTYKGGVYDVTEYVHHHPGGQDIILSAGGTDLGAIWEAFGIHRKNGKALPMLEAMRIGALAEEDRAEAEEKGRDFSTRFKRMDRLQWYRAPRLALVVVSLPFCWAIRYALRIIGHLQITQPLVNLMAWMLPISVPGYYRARAVPAKQRDGEKTRVAVVGGGIAGCGAAYALTESGYDVTVYEGRPKLGGNAQTYNFGGTHLDGLVSYWDSRYYANYCSLLKKLGCKSDFVYMPHVMHSTLRGKDEYYTFREGPIHGSGYPEFIRPQPSNNEEFAGDLKKYGRAMSCVRFVEHCFSWSRASSFYNLYNGFLPMANPCNFISMKTMCCSIFGCSKDFWDNVLLPYNAFNHFGLDCENVPSVCMPVVEDICPMLPTGQNNEYRSWTWSKKTSAEVFQKLTAKSTVKLSTRVAKVNDLGNGKHCVVDDEGNSQIVDRVVFACPASAVANALEPQSTWLERTLLRGVMYRDDTDPLWVKGWAHQDATAPFPAPEADNMSKNCAFWLSVSPAKETHHASKSKVHFELTQNARVISGQCFENPPNALMTFNLRDPSKIDSKSVVEEVCISRSHPTFSYQNLFLTYMLPLIQGKRGIYYCSNYTAANGHDISLLSGFSCAQAIGAEYPLKGNPDKEEGRRAARDFALLSGMMGLDQQSPVKELGAFGVKCSALLGLLRATGQIENGSQSFLSSAGLTFWSSTA